jgi:hypothetical protein
MFVNVNKTYRQQGLETTIGPGAINTNSTNYDTNRIINTEHSKPLVTVNQNKQHKRNTQNSHAALAK